jgi:hypothetical protein
MNAKIFVPWIRLQAVLRPESTEALLKIREKCFPGQNNDAMSTQAQRVFGLKLENIPTARETISSITSQFPAPRFVSTGDIRIAHRRQGKQARFILGFQPQGNQILQQVSDALVRSIPPGESLRIGTPLSSWLKTAQVEELRGRIEDIVRNEPLELSVSALAIALVTEKGTEGKPEWEVFEFTGPESQV